MGLKGEKVFKCALQNSTTTQAAYKRRCTVQCESCKHWHKGEKEMATDATDKTVDNGTTMVPASRHTSPPDGGWTYFHFGVTMVPRGRFNRLTELLAEINCRT